MERTSNRDNPFYAGAETLFSGLDESMESLSESQREDYFLARWMEAFDPYRHYPEVFRRGRGAERENERRLRDMKVQFGILVVRGEWSERKYAMVLDAMFTARRDFGPGVLKEFGALHDQGRLEVQVAQRRRAQAKERGARRRRI